MKIALYTLEPTSLEFLWHQQATIANSKENNHKNQTKPDTANVIQFCTPAIQKNSSVEKM